jgi:hypothetical protein
MNSIEIKSNKTKLTLMLLGSLMFIFLGGWLAINPDKFLSTIFRNVFFIRIAGIVAILFFGVCLIFLLKSIFTNKFNLVINEKGIIDNSSYISVGMILWDDITSIKSISVVSTKFLIINVKDPNKYINIQNTIKQNLLRRTLKTYGTPISISSNTLAFNFDELEKAILKFYNKYKNK